MSISIHFVQILKYVYLSIVYFVNSIYYKLIVKIFYSIYYISTFCDVCESWVCVLWVFNFGCFWLFTWVCCLNLFFVRVWSIMPKSSLWEKYFAKLKVGSITISNKNHFQGWSKDPKILNYRLQLLYHFLGTNILCIMHICTMYCNVFLKVCDNVWCVGKLDDGIHVNLNQMKTSEIIALNPNHTWTTSTSTTLNFKPNNHY